MPQQYSRNAALYKAVVARIGEDTLKRLDRVGKLEEIRKILPSLTVRTSPVISLSKQMAGTVTIWIDYEIILLSTVLASVDYLNNVTFTLQKKNVFQNVSPRVEVVVLR